MGKPRKHKRKGPKSTRSGCLLCKPHKRQGVDDPPLQERKAQEAERAQIADSAFRGFSKCRNSF